MKKTVIIISIFFVLLTIQSYSQVVVIANKSISVGSIDKTQIKNIYSLDLKKLGAVELSIFDITEESATKSSFYGYIGISNAELKKVWLKHKLNGTGVPPKSVSNESDMLEKVKSTPGAIGYINKSKVTGDVKVLFEIK
jgi:ABC-type phosphate transport system substrate-binding protein